MFEITINHSLSNISLKICELTLVAVLSKLARYQLARAEKKAIVRGHQQVFGDSFFMTSISRSERLKKAQLQINGAFTIMQSISSANDMYWVTINDFAMSQCQ